MKKLVRYQFDPETDIDIIEGLKWIQNNIYDAHDINEDQRKSLMLLITGGSWFSQLDIIRTLRLIKLAIEYQKGLMKNVPVEMKAQKKQMIEKWYEIREMLAKA